MKKLLTLMLAALCMGTVQAQSTTTNKAKRVISGQRRDYDPNRSGTDEAKDVIRRRQDRTVYEGQPQRRRNRDYSYEDNGKHYKKNKYHKHRHKHAYRRKGNNGKHLGWQKGKGNPHRYR